MKINNFVVALSVICVLGFFGSASFVNASSCDDDNYHTKSGHGAMGKQFADINTNGDKSISFDEFKTVYPSFGKKAFDHMDLDKSGGISQEEWGEFVKMHHGMGKGKGQKKNYHSATLPDPFEFNAHFPDMDENKDDRVTLDEFKAYFSESSEHEKVFDAIDLDESGDLNHHEWHEFKSSHGLKHVD
jgi:Ca2+-binding EF-hand superfamily protein